MKLVPAALAATLVAAPMTPALASDLSTMQLALNTQQSQTFTMTQLPGTYQVAAGMITSATPAKKAAAASGDKNPWIAGLLNFFLMGAGYVYNGEDVPLGLALTASSVGLTYVELGLQQQAFAPGGNITPWAVMFGSVLLANTFLAMDAYAQAEEINAR